MCGILGFVGSKNLLKVKRDLSFIQHRGYDDSCAAYVGSVNLGMNRLAIQDLTKGYYPFRYQNLTLIYNGEIYNYLELKALLEKDGITFKTHCDAEVILPLFSKYGMKAFHLLEGMFAVCIVDQQHKKLYLARDKSGEKPLYYSQTLNDFYFASELKCLLHQAKDFKISKPELADYLLHGSTNYGKTLMRGIQKLSAGQCLTFDLISHTTKLQIYWQVQVQKKPSSLSQKELLNQLDNLLEKAVNTRLVADVPVGAFLSGGIDSSLVSFYAQQVKKNLNTFSISFPHFEKHNEADFSLQVAQKLNTHHKLIEFTSQDARNIMNDLGQLIDEPIVDPAFMPTLLLAKEARKKVKVVLTGEGADEIFGGYYRYYKYGLKRKINNICRKGYFLYTFKNVILPHRLQRFDSLFQDKIFYSPQQVWDLSQVHQLIPSLLSVPVHQEELSANSLLQMQLSDYHWYLPEQLLMKVDKATMANNLESRAPFLDSEIIKFGFNLPFRYKIQGLHNKYLLRVLFSKYISKEWAYRPKHGFSLPLNTWFRNELKDMVYDELKALEKSKDFIDVKYFKQIIDEHMLEQNDNANKIWSVIVLSKWLTANNLSF